VSGIHIFHINKSFLISETIPISHHGHIQGEDSYNADLPIIPLIWIRQSTNNFSELCKLGAGGFGPVYKVCFLIFNTEMLMLPPSHNYCLFNIFSFSQNNCHFTILMQHLLFFSQYYNLIY